MTQMRDSSVFETVKTWAMSRQDVAVGVTGSHSKGNPDRYSDFDLLVLSRVDPEPLRVEFRSDVVSKIGRCLAEFGAKHLGFNSMDVYYIIKDDHVIKIDVSFHSIASGLEVPEETKVLLDPNGLLSLCRKPAQLKVAEDELFEKLLGWAWFTHSRIERGEYFAAARSIDFSRETALLPLLLKRLGLPEEGHRRIESRLPKPEFNRLLATYPAGLTCGELRRAMDRFYELVADEAKALLHEEKVPGFLERLNEAMRLATLDRARNDLASY